MGRDHIQARIERLAEHSEGVSQRAYARRIESLARKLREAREEGSPAMALHHGGTRALLFQLEALARAHRATLDDAQFLPLHQAFKTLEDGLGAVDFHDALLRRLGEDEEPSLRAYFVGRRMEACASVERWLNTHGWWPRAGKSPEALDDIVSVLENARWPSRRKERRRIGEYYARSAIKLHERMAAGEFDFNSLESGVHELRRKVRWLSILPAAFDGLFVRIEDEQGDQALAWYRKPEVLASPYNDFPSRKDVPDPLKLDSPAFLAMSWLIGEIGVWKDRGQMAEALGTAWRDLGTNAKAAKVHTRRILGKDLATHAEIKRAVNEAVRRVVRDEVLHRLARGVEDQSPGDS